MNSSQTQNLGLQSNWRRVGLILLLLLFFILAPVAAQRVPKRITSVWTATTAEGSRVHVVSDSPINDYEGYTRGGRFYVKIPLADLPTARGSLLGRGFDDVQIQRYGDGIIISFRLQAGTAARVEQAANRLEVVFTTPGGSRSAMAGARETDEATRTRVRRISDSAGPAPVTSTPTSRGSERRPSGQRRERPNSGSGGQRTTGESAGNNNSAGVDGRKPTDSQNSNSSEKVAPTPQIAAKASPGPTPFSSPTPAASPTTTPSGLSGSASPGSSPTATAAPGASSAPSQPASAATPANSANSNDNDWKSRVHYWRVWAELNWVPLLVGVLVALALLVLLFFWRAAKRSRGDASEGTQPTQAPGETVAVASPSPTSDAGQSAGAAGSQIQSPAASHTPSSNATPSEPVKHQGEEPEREVFEL